MDAAKPPVSQTGAHLANIMLHRTHDGQYILYSKHPSTEKQSWPERTAKWCWHCCAPFEAQPVPIPTAYDKVRNIYAVYGNFCSFSCAAKFLEVTKLADAPYQRRLLARMAREVFENTRPIKNAPDRWRRVEFGGDLTLEEFRSCNQKCRTYMRMPPFVMQSLMIEEHLMEPPKDAYLQSSVRDVSMQDVHHADGSEARGQYGDFLKERDIVIQKPDPDDKPQQRKIETSQRRPRKPRAAAATGEPSTRVSTRGTLFGYIKNK